MFLALLLRQQHFRRGMSLTCALDHRFNRMTNLHPRMFKAVVSPCTSNHFYGRSLDHNTTSKGWRGSIRVCARIWIRSATTITSDTSINGNIPCGGINIAVGQEAHVIRTFTPRDLQTFAMLSGDTNPLHQIGNYDHNKNDVNDINIHHNNDDKYDPHKPLVHGILVASLFSCIFGNLIPGSVYRKQSLTFRQPVYPNQTVVGRVVVLSVRPLPRRMGTLVKCSTHIYRHETNVLCIQGEAEVLLPFCERRHGDDDNNNSN